MIVFRMEKAFTGCGGCVCGARPGHDDPRCHRAARGRLPGRAPGLNSVSTVQWKVQGGSPDFIQFSRN